MLRRAAVATFVSAILLVVACGRQITPEPSSSNLAGHVVVRFRVSGPLAFTKYDYQILIDTCGQGVPYPNPAVNSYNNYGYSINVGASPFGVATVYPVLIQYLHTTGSGGLSPQQIPLSPSLVSLETNSNGQGNEFEVIFDREYLDNPLGVAQPCPTFTQPPASTDRAAIPQVAAGAPPLAKPAERIARVTAVRPQAAASTAPAPQATLPIQSTWTMNFVVLTAPPATPLDSLGVGGPTDVSYGGIVVDTQSLQQLPVTKIPDGQGPPTDPSAQIISGGEVDNYP